MSVKAPIRRLEDLRVAPLVRAVAGSTAGNLLDLLPRAITHEGIVVEHHIREGRFQRSLSLIAGVSALLGGIEVAYEHVIGSYSQRIMYSPVLLSPLLTIAGIWGAFNRRVARTLLPLASVALLLDGAIGFGYHIRGIARKPGGWRLPVYNVIMGPPIFAPLLLGLSGLLGLIASFLRREDDPRFKAALPLPRPRPVWTHVVPRRLAHEGIVWEQDVREGRFQQALGIATAISAILNGIESLYPHYKNNFSYKVQWTPILLSPLIAAAGIGAFFSRTIARTLLPVTSALAILNGGLGFFYHARGIVRRPGGLKTPVYNTLYGPPILAPLLFAATGFLGVLTSLLRRAK